MTTRRGIVAPPHADLERMAMPETVNIDTRRVMARTTFKSGL